MFYILHLFAYDFLFVREICVEAKEYYKSSLRISCTQSKMSNFVISAIIIKFEFSTKILSGLI